MRAGRGVIHDERRTRSCVAQAAICQSVQLWINMPKGAKHTEPAYRHVTAQEIPLLPRDRNGSSCWRARRRRHRPRRTSGDPFVVQASLTSGSTLLVDVSHPCELALYVMTGAIAIAGEAVEPGQLARSTSGDTLRVVDEEKQRVAAGRCDPLDAPIMAHGPFVMNTIAELERAIRDYHAGRMGRSDVPRRAPFHFFHRKPPSIHLSQNRRILPCPRLRTFLHSVAAYRAHFVMSGLSKIAAPATQWPTSSPPVPICSVRFRERGDRGGGRRARSAAWFSNRLAATMLQSSHSRRRVVHNNMADQNQMIHFLKNIASLVAFAGRRFWRRRISSLDNRRKSVSVPAVNLLIRVFGEEDSHV